MNTYIKSKSIFSCRTYSIITLEIDTDTSVFSQNPELDPTFLPLICGKTGSDLFFTISDPDPKFWPEYIFDERALRHKRVFFIQTFRNGLSQWSC